jgi:F-type H+-transporting ATPase subunit delta
MASSTRQSRLAAISMLAKAKTDLTIAAEFFAVSAALQSSKQLRGLLSDPSAEAVAKKHAVEAVFGAKISAVTLDLVAQLSAMRWSATRDLPETAERLGVRVVAAAEASRLDDLIAELFAVSTLVGSDSELELALSSTRATAEEKQQLLGRLIGSQVSAAATLLTNSALSSRTSKRVAQVLSSYADWLSEFANESVAHIRVAKPLSSSQLQRLGTALSKSFGRELKLNVELDPNLIGGLRVSVAGEVIDASVFSRVNQARLQLS